MLIQQPLFTGRRPQTSSKQPSEIVAHFNALSEETLTLGNQVRPFWPDHEKDHRILSNLSMMAIDLLRLRDRSFLKLGLRLGKLVQQWRNTILNALDQMHFQHDRGIELLTHLTQQLKGFSPTVFESFSTILEAAIKAEQRTIRSYSGPLPGGGHIEVL